MTILRQVSAPFARKVNKPWGSEIIFTSPGLPYTGKIIHIDAGKRSSLQVHNKKQESWYLLRGRGKIIWEDRSGALSETTFVKGRGYTCKIGQRHRLVGITDCDIIEVSTPELGTTYRLEDDYKRSDETEQMREEERKVVNNRLPARMRLVLAINQIEQTVE